MASTNPRLSFHLMSHRKRRPRYVVLDPGVIMGWLADIPDPVEPEDSSRPRPSKRPRKGRRRPDKCTEADRREAWTAPTQDETPPPKIP